jgi:hypothetical protein
LFLAGHAFLSRLRGGGAAWGVPPTGEAGDIERLEDDLAHAQVARVAAEAAYGKAVAAKDAEIEALRSQVEGWQAQLASMANKVVELERSSDAFLVERQVRRASPRLPSGSAWWRPRRRDSTQALAWACCSLAGSARSPAARRGISCSARRAQVADWWGSRS